ncbi:hypothetical protein PGTUg99_005898 [Puccinia graminis f. sp. tritici]|uniref:Uncharacterized protein n=1 Tax=Puccinia graminis f. sp. tritici TaxID=56615 RepID=A0A5B0N8D6_PUCGR|nr:hypothetical protein PGTUg99_005898 [Puccinia graminis f. sp. tritici]
MDEDVLWITFMKSSYSCFIHHFHYLEGHVAQSRVHHKLRPTAGQREISRGANLPAPAQLLVSAAAMGATSHAGFTCLPAVGIAADVGLLLVLIAPNVGLALGPRSHPNKKTVPPGLEPMSSHWVTGTYPTEHLRAIIGLPDYHQAISH